MPRFVAFLRAINVGGHTVRMEQLRHLFEELSFSHVETFIASGNVIFDSRSKDARALEARIEKHLQSSLGYKVSTFIRSIDDLARIAGHEPFAPEEGSSLFIAFLAAPPAAEAIAKLVKLGTATNDDVSAHGREIYWLRRKSFSESALAGPLFEKTIGIPATVRNATTVRKLAAKHCGVV
jgi:uncharacterized protein (DUF1697 family)